MPIYNLDKGPIFVYYNSRTTDQIDYLLSKRLQSYFQEREKDEKTAENALSFCFDWCTGRMLQLLNAQTQVCFFQTIFILHEISCPYSEMQPGLSPVPAIDNWDFGIYRRVLKLCLEQACELSLIDTEQFSLSYVEVIEPVLSELIYLGSLACKFSSFLAEEKSYQGSFLFSFIDGVYNFQRSIRSELRAFQMLSYVKANKTDAFDRSAIDNFTHAVKNCFEIEFDKIVATITFVHEEFKDRGGRLILIKWNAYPMLLEQLFKIPYEKAALFLRGLTLFKSNKLTLQESIYRSDNLNRYLYRPILVLNVNGEEVALVGQEVFHQSIVSLCLQAFGWRKFPAEWKNGCFEKYIENTARKNDRILEDPIEKVFLKNGLLYDRNICNLLRSDNRNRSIVPDPGQIDFLFVYQNILYVAESKHQRIRYDMNSFLHDTDYFTAAYNEKLQKKVLFIKNHLADVEVHFRCQTKSNLVDLTIVDVVGLFIINTPSYVMVGNEVPVLGLPLLERYLSKDLPLNKAIDIDPDLF